MSIYQALVAQQTKIISEYKKYPTVEDAVVQAILTKIPPNQSNKLTYVYERYLFHYISNEQGFVFMCVSDDTFGRRVPFVFLQDIEARFLSSDHQDFKKVIKERMKFYSNKDDLKKVQGEIDNVKDVMSHNIERVLERGGKIDLLVNKTDGLSQQAFGFKKRSTAVKRSMWWKNVKLICLICCVLTIILSIVLLMTTDVPGNSNGPYQV